jgi:hypothetical protein
VSRIAKVVLGKLFNVLLPLAAILLLLAVAVFFVTLGLLEIY